MSKIIRKDLSLADKIKVISEYEKSGKSYRRLADEYGVGKTQIQQTIKRKAEYMTAYEDNACSSRKITKFHNQDRSLIRTLCVPLIG